MHIGRLSPPPADERSEAPTAAPLAGPPGKFLIELQAPRSRSYEKAHIIFRTDLPERPEIVVSLEATYRGALSSIPESLAFQSTGEPVAKSVEIELFEPGNELSFQIVGDGKSPVPFLIENIKRPSGSGDDRATVTIRFDEKRVRDTTLSRAHLNVVSGPDRLEIPLFGTMSSTRGGD